MNPRVLLAGLLLTAPAAATSPPPPNTPPGGSADHEDPPPAPAALPEWGIGAGPVVGFSERHHIDGPLFPMGLSLRLNLGAALSESLTTGIALRGAWLTPPNARVKSGDKARDLEQLEAAVHWYQEWSCGPRFRFGVGPRVSALLGDGSVVNDAVLFGAEANFEFGWHFGMTRDTVHAFWVGPIFSQALGGTSGTGLGREHEFSLELAATFALEQSGRAPPLVNNTE